ncbi:unnamed protein product [Pleuronectes platessa]|uniref:Uncharacterized protein n=1 Tax=Pleuronectes platessa TaxID=8262 RepID=A0A9N7VME6_PLEPL|nr:unnamed protein product [Pleuronectes platessa]
MTFSPWQTRSSGSARLGTDPRIHQEARRQPRSSAGPEPLAVVYERPSAQRELVGEVGPDGRSGDEAAMLKAISVPLVFCLQERGPGQTELTHRGSLRHMSF